MVRPADTATEMTQIVMPGHCNALGTIFGGVIMSWIDVAAAVAAQRLARRNVVTALMDTLVFRAPARIGDVVVVRATVNWAGRTSMEVGVRVEVEDPRTGDRTHTASAFLTFVAVDATGRPVAVPPLVPGDDEERRRFEAAAARRDARVRQRQT
jgi:acyl-CoA hydrolase